MVDDFDFIELGTRTEESPDKAVRRAEEKTAVVKGSGAKKVPKGTATKKRKKTKSSAKRTTKKASKNKTKSKVKVKTAAKKSSAKKTGRKSSKKRVRTPSKKKGNRKATKKKAQEEVWVAVEHPAYMEDILPRPLEEECFHEHHMHCIRCGLIQFTMGLVTGIAVALIIARVAVL